MRRAVRPISGWLFEPVPNWDVSDATLDVRPMLGRTVGLGEVPEALDATRDANEAARIVVVP